MTTTTNMADGDTTTGRKQQQNTLNLTALGFCGADDSVDPHFLGVIAHAYPFVEFGVLFRPDLEGRPRYASAAWVERLGKVAATITDMKLAAHLCGSRVDEVLRGDDGFVAALPALGFRRVQINATGVNGVRNYMATVAVAAASLVRIVRKYEGTLTFILQRSEETRPLWDAVSASRNGVFPPNLTGLVDESKGTGTTPTCPWPSPPAEYEIGYAGGVGPDNLKTVLRDVRVAAHGRPVWVDMESSLRSTLNGNDVFDLHKCHRCVLAVCEDAGLPDHGHPTWLPPTSGR